MGYDYDCDRDACRNKYSSVNSYDSKDVSADFDKWIDKGS
jgi:hypothetical protein